MRRAASVAFLLLLIALVPAVLVAWFHPRAPEWAAPAETDLITWTDAQSLNNALWIDARTPEEFARGHVPSALTLPPAEWDARIEAVLMEWNPERPVVVYCGGSDCRASHAVAQRLRDELGFTDVHVLAGGSHGEERGGR